MFANLLIFLTCLISGLLTGMLGIGGGLVIIPMFMTILPAFGVTHYTIHQIIGISATCVFINSAISIFYRRHERFLPKKLILQIALVIIAGTILGNILSDMSSKNAILLIYMAFCLVSIYLLKKDIYFDLKHSKFKGLMYIIFLFSSILSAILGIGGAVFFAIGLKCFVVNDTKKLLPSTTLLVAINALFVFSEKVVMQIISLEIIPIAIVASLLSVKLGVLISKKLTAKFLNNALLIVMILGLVRIMVEFFTHP